MRSQTISMIGPVVALTLWLSIGQLIMSGLSVTTGLSQAKIVHDKSEMADIKDAPKLADFRTLMADIQANSNFSGEFTQYVMLCWSIIFVIT